MRQQTGLFAYVLPQVKACNACYVNALSSCHTVINSPVFSQPGQVHQQQQGRRCLPHTSRAPHLEGWVKISAGN